MKMSANLVNYSVDYHLDANLLLTSLHNSRLNNKFTDIIIKVGDREYPAHRIVLANSDLVGISFDYQLQIFHEFDRKYVKNEIMEDLLTFLYTRKITLRLNTVHLILEASNYLKIQFLISACEQFFINIFETKNVVEWLLLSVKYGLENFKNHCLDYMIGNLDKIFCEAKIFELSFEDFKCLLHELNNRSNSEIVNKFMLESVIVWANYKENPSLLLPKLLRQISFSEKPFKKAYLHSNFPYLESNHCSRFLVNSLKQMMNYTELLYFGGSKKIDKVPNSTPEWPVTKFELSLDSNSEFVGKVPLRFPEMTGVEMAFQCGVFMDNKIYLIGGCVSDRASTKTNILGEKYLTNRVLSFDYSDKQWQRLPPLPHPIMNGAAASCNGFLYVTGGIQRFINGPPEDYSEAYRFNVKTMEWTKVKPMNYARFLHQLVALDGHLYAISGYCLRGVKRSNSSSPILTNIRKLSQNIFNNSKDGGFNSAIRNEVERYNPITNEWTTVASCHYEHALPFNKISAVVHCGKIYVCSDIGFEVYCPQADKWTPLCRIHKSVTRLSLVSMGRKLIAFSDKSGILYCYDVDNNRWNFQAKMEVDSSLYENLIGVCPVVAQW